MRLDLSGRVVLVTGAASGIGAAVARLAAETGATLALTDRDGDGLRRVAAQAGAVALEADLLRPEAPAEVAREVLARLGRIDGLVNAAGLTTRGGVTDATLAAWEELFAVNARAPFFLMQEAVADMRARGAQGVIVNILSMNAHGGQADLAVYAATKGALLTLTRNAAAALMAERIRVNGINLGWTDTEAERRMQAVTLRQGEGWIEAAGARMPLGRLLAPEEAARLAVFLLSDASAPLSGAAIDLDQRVLGTPG